MRKSPERSCHHSIYIICEGSKSEPWFIRRFIEWASGKYQLYYYAEVFPTPINDDEMENDDSSYTSKSGRRSSGRRLTIPIEDTEMSGKAKGGNPLLWVEHGKEKLDSYSEVFVVFDKDGHPLMEEAFNLAVEPNNNGKKINIIFNSRSFEYYMLLHFERIYRSFEKTECGEKQRKHTRSFHCCLPNAVAGKECGGSVCINGYARKNGYWSNSKDEHTFTSASNIWRGMKNGEYVRDKALVENNNTPIFLLNPYVDFQTLLSRLMDKRLLRSGGTISKDCGRGESQTISREGYGLKISNGSSILPLKLESGWISYYSYPNDSILFEDFRQQYTSLREAELNYTKIQEEYTLIKTCPKLEIHPECSISLPLELSCEDNLFAICKFNGNDFLLF